MNHNNRLEPKAFFLAEKDVLIIVRLHEVENKIVHTAILLFYAYVSNDTTNTVAYSWRPHPYRAIAPTATKHFSIERRYNNKNEL